MKLDFDSEYFDLANKLIADFKMCEKSDQIRIVLKHNTEPKFECFCFEYGSGNLVFYLPFNSETSKVPD